MGVMYNSQCVLNHPSGPEEAAQCITVNAELLLGVARRGALRFDAHSGALFTK